jgi:hypothetical protein
MPFFLSFGDLDDMLESSVKKKVWNAEQELTVISVNRRIRVSVKKGQNKFHSGFALDRP